MHLKVITDSDRSGIGTIDAQVGMELANGYTISKVHEKSVIGQCKGHTEKFFAPTSIFYSEAICWGFSNCAVDKQAENLAALTRKFRQGESVYQQYVEYSYAPALSDRIEEAGYSFAKQVEAHRQKRDRPGARKLE